MLLTIFLTILSIVVPIIIPYLIKILKLNIDEKSQQLLIDAILMGIKYAEEQASRQRKLQGKVMTSDEKEDLAVDYIMKNTSLNIEPQKLRMLIRAVKNNSGV